MQKNSENWLDFKRDQDTGIETIRAHFYGHAYDPHWHDEYLIGTTEQGIQQFNCRAQKQISVPGTSFLLEPGEIHDGDAPHENGFTYQMLFLKPAFLQQRVIHLFDDSPDKFELNIESTLTQDPRLAQSISNAFHALHYQEPKIVKDACLDQMMLNVTQHLSWRKQPIYYRNQHSLALRTQAFLHANLNNDIGLVEVAKALAVDRYRLSRVFKSFFGIAPHAYLIQLRLVKARALLAQKYNPIDVANQLCFADQSHLGRWFKRCYQLTPANYQKSTNLPDL
jgi:AraC-like DNA-binding protein